MVHYSNYEKSQMQGCVTFDVTSAELVSGTQCTQDMLFIIRVIESMGGLKIRKPRILEIDNKGAVDISHNWSVRVVARGMTAFVKVLYKR